MIGVTDQSTEAEKLRSEIAEAEAKVKTLKAQIRHREGRLRRMVVDTYNEASEPLDGMTTETREIVIGSNPCTLSPIGICAYSDRVISLPGQRDRTNDEASRTDACLFCGKKNPKSPWR